MRVARGDMPFNPFKQTMQNVNNPVHQQNSISTKGA
jgi:hypothetical protein